MAIVVQGVIAGLVGTVVMDVLNILVARTRFRLDAQGRRHRRPARLGALAEIEKRRRPAG